MKFANLEIKRNYYAKDGQFPYEGTLTMSGELGYSSVKLSDQAIRAILAIAAPDATALFQGAALQSVAELRGLAEVTTDASPQSSGFDGKWWADQAASTIHPMDP